MLTAASQTERAARRGSGTTPTRLSNGRRPTVKANQERARFALLAIGALLFARAAGAEAPVEEIIVHGKPTEVVLDQKSWRIDVKQHASVLARSVRDALATK